jgi:uncharacterized membrane protein YeaQ/YmgE (transglycosylase-associated protein family)
MDNLAWILAGAALGWLTYTFVGLNEQRGVTISVIIGAIGALVGAKALAPMFMAAAVPPGSISAGVLVFAVAAAAVCLVLGNLVYRRWGV